jgi:hypothetical protein
MAELNINKNLYCDLGLHSGQFYVEITGYMSQDEIEIIVNNKVQTIIGEG